MSRRRKSIPATEAWNNPWGPLFEGVCDAQGRPVAPLHVCKIEDLGITGRTIEGWEEDGTVACLRWAGMSETSWWRRVEAPSKSYAIRIDGQIYEFDGRRLFAGQERWEGHGRPGSRGWTVKKMIAELARRKAASAVA